MVGGGGCTRADMFAVTEDGREVDWQPAPICIDNEWRIGDSRLWVERDSGASGNGRPQSGLAAITIDHYSPRRIERDHGATSLRDGDETSLGLGKALETARRDVINRGHHLIPAVPTGTTDPVWIPEVARRGLIVIGRDRHLHTRPGEVEVLRAEGLRVFRLATKRDLTTWGYLVQLLHRWDEMEPFRTPQLSERSVQVAARSVGTSVDRLLGSGRGREATLRGPTRPGGRDASRRLHPSDQPAGRHVPRCATPATWRAAGSANSAPPRIPTEMPSKVKTTPKAVTKSAAWATIGARDAPATATPPPGDARVALDAAVSPRYARYTGTSASTQGEMNDTTPAMKASARLI